MPKTDTLGDRLKSYEETWNGKLPIRTPVIVRADGRAFHTLTKKFEKPFDAALHQAMVVVAQHLCQEMVNARFAYTQSDEISILLFPKSTVSGYWFENRLQKLASVTASLASVVFYRQLSNQLGHVTPSFDARAFALPESEVYNYFLWRQLDAIRNSVAGLAQANFSHRQLENKKQDDMLSMLLTKNIDWHQLDEWKQRGSAIEIEDQIWTSRAAPDLRLNKKFFEKHLIVSIPEKKVS